MEPALHLWQKIMWGPDYIQRMYADWGLHCKFKPDIGLRFYDKALELKEDIPRILYERSTCKRNIAQNASALKDIAFAAQLTDGTFQMVELEYCNAVYNMNEFEKSKINLHRRKTKFKGFKVAEFNDRVDIVDENFHDNLGPSLGPFIMTNEKLFHKVRADLDRKNRIDSRPQWKILKEQAQCDVESVILEEGEHLSPRELARRERCSRVFTQIYLNRAWSDVLFMKNLREDPNLFLPAFQYSSTKQLRELIDVKYLATKTILKMLQSRSPLYNEQYRRAQKKSVAVNYLQAHLHRVQYQTRRNMVIILRSIHYLRRMKYYDKLSKFVEDVMGDYVVLKTARIMPWKFEFINDVYNTLALAQSEQYEIPKDLHSIRQEQRLDMLLQLHRDKSKDKYNFVFGDKSTFNDVSKVAPLVVTNRLLLTRLEKRMRFAAYSIERCYLLNEIARCYLRQGRFEECRSVARKAVLECPKCASHLWQFLSQMLIVKSFAMQQMLEYCRDALKETRPIAERLQDERLTSFIDMCSDVCELDYNQRKRNLSRESLRVKARLSTASMRSLSGRSSKSEDATASVGRTARTRRGTMAERRTQNSEVLNSIKSESDPRAHARFSQTHVLSHVNSD